MSRVFFSTWSGKLVNNSSKPIQEWEESAYNLPVQYNIYCDSFIIGGSRK